MSKIDDRIIADLKSRQNLIDKKYGEGSAKKLIELSEGLSSLYDERRKVVFDRDLSREERINRLSDIKNRIKKIEGELSPGLMKLH